MPASHHAHGTCKWSMRRSLKNPGYDRAYEQIRFQLLTNTWEPTYGINHETCTALDSHCDCRCRRSAVCRRLLLVALPYSWRAAAVWSSNGQSPLCHPCKERQDSVRTRPTGNRHLRPLPVSALRQQPLLVPEPAYRQNYQYLNMGRLVCTIDRFLD